MISQNKRAGFVIPLALVMCTLILGLGYVLLQLSTGDSHLIRHAIDREVGFHVAKSYLDLATKEFEKSVQAFNRGESSESALSLHQKMLYTLQSLKNSNLDQSIEEKYSSTLFQALLPGEELGEFDFSLKLANRRALFQESSYLGHPVQADEQSLTAILKVILYRGKAKIEAIHSTELKLVDIIPKPWSRFVLHLRNPGFFISQLEENTSKIELVLEPGSGFDSIERKDNQIRNFLDDQGWVYLGMEEQIAISSAHKSFLGTSGLLIQDELQFNMLSTDGNSTSLNEDGEFQYFVSKGPMSQATLNNPFVKLTPLNSERFLSNFLPFSDKEEIQPTLTFGPVVLRYPLMVGIRNPELEVFTYLPYLTPDKYNSDDWPTSWSQAGVDLLKDHFETLNPGSPYEAYSKWQSRWIEEDLNSSLLDLLVPEDSNSIYYSEDNAFRSGKLSSSGSQRHALKQLDHDKYTIETDDNKIAFLENYLTNPPPPEIYRHRVARIYDSYENLKRELKLVDCSFEFGGYVLVKGKLILEEELRFNPGNGGILVSEGDLIVRSPLNQSGEEPLTLLSLGGNVLIQHPGPHHANLISRKGLVQIPSGVEIHGSVAALDLEFKNLHATPIPPHKHLRYTVSFKKDWDKSANNLRLSYDKNWNFFQPR